MNKIIQWIMLFAFVIDMCVNANNFSYDQAYHTERKTWKAAFVECGSNGLEFDKNVFINIDVRSDKEFWIGMAIYRVTTPWIEVLGCYAEPSGKEVFKTPSIVLCQKQCETYPLFGYSELTESCFCQHNENSSFTSECRDTHYLHFSFVYKVYTGHVSDNDDGECTTLFCSVGDNGLKSAHCNDTTDSGRISRCNNGYIVGWGIPYLRSKQLCLERFQLLLPPETYCQSNIHAGQGILSWTNVFRAVTEAKLTQAEAGTKEPLCCLAVTLTEQNTKREPKITRRACNDELQFVCRKAEPSATTQSQSTVNARKIKKDASATLAIGAVIGGVLVSCSLITVLAVLIVCKVRSKGMFSESNTHNYEDTNRVKFSKTTYADLHNTKQEIAKPTSNQTFDIDKDSAPVYEEINECGNPRKCIS